MPTLYLAFANSDKHPLDTLRREDRKVNEALAERHLRGDFIIKSDQFATKNSIIRGLSQFQNDIELFLYSGHAGGSGLELEDGAAHSEGIAALLGRCPNLKLVILNGCSTVGQVEALFQNNVPVVIATSAPVNDKRATQFSITFFEELCKNRQSINVAFTAAIAAAKVYGAIEADRHTVPAASDRDGLSLKRAIGHINEPTKPLWGLYCQADKQHLLEEWRLPEKQTADTTNRHINDAIEQIFADYGAILTGEEARQDVILKRLPYSISEPIRKLLAPSDNSGQLFYDRPSPERFRMLLYAYRNIMAFVTYALLAQLWEHKRKPQNGLNTEGVSNGFKTWLNSDFRSDNKRSHWSLFQQLRACFKTHDLPFFLEELNGFEAIHNEIKDSIDFLEQQVAHNPQSNLTYLCAETEQHLAIVLYYFGFLIHYGLTSVKDINVLFYQHSQEPDFEHKIVKLQQAFTSLDDSLETDKNHHKTATILLRRIDDKSKYLYLSPFFIDENAYLKAQKAKLCFFVSYDSVHKRFHFRHVSKPDDTIQIEKKKIAFKDRILGNPDKTKGTTDQSDHYFSLINGQFSAFCKDVCGKTLEEL